MTVLMEVVVMEMRTGDQRIAGLRMLWTAMQTTGDFRTQSSLWRAAAAYCGVGRPTEPRRAGTVGRLRVA
jgi:hypothetical protein